MVGLSPDPSHAPTVDRRVRSIDVSSIDVSPSVPTPPAPTPGPESIGSSTATSTPRGTLLVVEDSRTARQLLRATLGAEWRLAEAESGERALRVARLLRPDAALVDVHLGGMDGIELVRRLREDADERVRKLPVVFLTGAPDDALRARTGALGADLLGKPAPLPVLRAALAQATARVS